MSAVTQAEARVLHAILVYETARGEGDNHQCFYEACVELIERVPVGRRQHWRDVLAQAVLSISTPAGRA